jgi:signal transduction histidine kinase
MPEPRRKAAFSRCASDQATPAKNGLGLAIVARLVATDRGDCRLEPTAGGGLTAVVDLPIEPGISA